MKCPHCGEPMGTAQRVPLTPRQSEFVRLLQLLEKRSEIPTLQKIANIMKIDKSSVHGMMLRLQDRGWIERKKGLTGGIILLH